MSVSEEFPHALRVGIEGVLNGCGGIRFAYYVEFLPYGSGFVCLYGLCRYIERDGAGDILKTIILTSRRCWS